MTIPSTLPHALCPCCASRFFGGIPCIEAYTQNRGYRLLWDRAKSPATFLCGLYASPSSPGNETIHEVLSCSTDIPLPSTRLGQTLQWFADLPDPEWPELQPLLAEHCEHLTKLREPAQALAWQGYSWKTSCPPLKGGITAILAVTFYKEPACSVSLLFECWRQIAKAMQSTL